MDLSDKAVYVIAIAIHYYSLVIYLKKEKEKKDCFLSTEVPFEQWRPFSLSDAGVSPKVNLSARGQNEEKENRKVWIHCSTSMAILLISTYMP